MNKYFTTVGLHDGNFEMEILVHSSANSNEESKKIGNSGKFHIGYLYEDKLVVKGETLTIKKKKRTNINSEYVENGSQLLVMKTTRT